jgi:hypothetical protein
MPAGSLHDAAGQRRGGVDHAPAGGLDDEDDTVDAFGVDGT